MNVLSIQNLYAGYNEQSPIIKGINLDIPDGEVIGIIGSNGSGKSTLVNAIFGITPYIYGIIKVGNKNIVGLSCHSIAKMGIGIFLQGGRVFPNLTVYENICLPISELNRRDAETRISEISQKFDLIRKKDKLNLKATYLSGGERQQLALAMVLVQNPSVIILDEPSAGLAPFMQNKVFDILREIKQTNKTTMLVIEQNVELLKQFTKSIKLLNNGMISN